MELNQIKELMNAMKRSGTCKVKIKRDGFELELERGSGDSGHSSAQIPLQFLQENPMKQDIAKHRSSISITKESDDLAPKSVSKPEKDNSTFIQSPMVGTFYSSPSPGEPNFVKSGDRVSKDTVVCIVEAMKVMNEVKAGVEGVVSEVLIENGHPVEFGSKLIKVK